MMPLAQQGGFLRLLCFCWASGCASLPADESTLAMLSGAGEGWFQNGWQMVRKCFEPHPDQSGNLTNKKLFELWQERIRWKEKSAEGGLKSADKRRKNSADKWKGEVKGGCEMVATNGQPNGNSSSSSSSSSSTLKDIAPEAGGEVAPKKSKEEKPPPKPRPRNLLFDAIAEVTGLDPSVKSNASLIGKVAASLAATDIPFTPEEVHKFGREYYTHCPHARKNGTPRPTPNEVERYTCKVRNKVADIGGSFGAIYDIPKAKEPNGNP